MPACRQCGNGILHLFFEPFCGISTSCIDASSSSPEFRVLRPVYIRHSRYSYFVLHYRVGAVCLFNSALTHRRVCAHAAVQACASVNRSRPNLGTVSDRVCVSLTLLSWFHSRAVTGLPTPEPRHWAERSAAADLVQTADGSDL